MKYKQIGWLITAHSCSPHPDPHLRSGDVCRWLLTRHWLLALSIVHSKHCPMHHHHQPSHRSLRSDNTGHCSQCASVHHGKVGGHCDTVIIILHKHFTNIPGLCTLSDREENVQPCQNTSVQCALASVVTCYPLLVTGCACKNVHRQ